VRIGRRRQSPMRIAVNPAVSDPVRSFAVDFGIVKMHEPKRAREMHVALCSEPFTLCPFTHLAAPRC